jgi:ATP-binding cassette subfamily F protein uup
VATTTIAMEGDGRAVIYAGGWTDYRAQRGEDMPAPPAPKPKAAPARPQPRRPRLSFTQAHRLEALPGEIERLSAEIGRLEVLLADPGLFARDPARFRKASEALVARQRALAAAEDEWLTLEALREAAG